MEIYVLVLIAFVVRRKETSLKLPLTESSLHEWQYGMVVKVSLEPDCLGSYPSTAPYSWAILDKCPHSLCPFPQKQQVSHRVVERIT